MSQFSGNKRDVVTIMLPISDENFELNMTDLSGRVIFSTTTQLSNYIWNTADLSNGIYMITAKQGSDFIQSQKVVIQH